MILPGHLPISLSPSSPPSVGGHGQPCASKAPAGSGLVAEDLSAPSPLLGLCKWGDFLRAKGCIYWCTYFHALRLQT